MESTKGNAKKIRFCLEYVTLKDTILTTKFVDCNKSYEREFDNDLAKNNKLCLIMRKVVYPYENMDG